MLTNNAASLPFGLNNGMGSRVRLPNGAQRQKNMSTKNTSCSYFLRGHPEHCMVLSLLNLKRSSSTKVVRTMNMRIVSKFVLSPAAFQIFTNIFVATLMPVYDSILVPAGRSFTGIPSGITSPQRTGIGMATTPMSMGVEVAVEQQPEAGNSRACWPGRPARVGPAHDNVVACSSEYVLYGVSDVLTMAGLQGFFYSETPEELRSLGMALFLISILGTGNLLNGTLIILIDKFTEANGQQSRFSSNLSKALTSITSTCCIVESPFLHWACIYVLLSLIVYRKTRSPCIVVCTYPQATLM